MSLFGNVDRRRILAVAVIAGTFFASSVLSSPKAPWPAPLRAGSARAIVNGENVGAYPWAAALIQMNDGRPVSERLICSGSLIKSQWVLTAAHCLGEDSAHVGLGDTVTLGRDLLASATGETRTIIAYHRMWRYPDWCPSGDQELCDVALVRLNAPSTHQDLDLANSTVLDEWNEGTAARAYGYGVDHVADLHRAHVVITDFRANHHTLFASGPTDATCSGDSGGPLVVSTSRGPHVAGIVRAGDCTPGTDASYVKVGYRGAENNSPVYLWITSRI